MALFWTKPTYLWQLTTINLGSNASPAKGLRRVKRVTAGVQEHQGGRARVIQTVGVPPPATNGDGLPDVRANLTAAATARGEEIEREVSKKMAEELTEHRRLTNMGRPDGHGGEIFIGPQYPT
jgi:hypothetical protein